MDDPQNREGSDRSTPPWGRYYAIARILENIGIPTGKMLNVGSRDTDFGGVNVDLQKYETIHLQASVLALPFQPDTFEAVLFSEVLEHVPSGGEGAALKEISRVLVGGGRLILTTPRHSLFYTFSDPYFFVRGHRHYTMSELSAFLSESGFELLSHTVCGGLEDRIWTFAHILFVLLLKRPLPSWVKGILTRAYAEENRNGATIILVARTSTPTP